MKIRMKVSLSSSKKYKNQEKQPKFPILLNSLLVILRQSKLIVN